MEWSEGYQRYLDVMTCVECQQVHGRASPEDYVRWCNEKEERERRRQEEYERATPEERESIDLEKKVYQAIWDNIMDGWRLALSRFPPATNK